MAVYYTLSSSSKISLTIILPFNLEVPDSYLPLTKGTVIN